MIDVSVIIPIYKGKEYLNYLTSILIENIKNYKELYNMSCEVIFINDYPNEEIQLYLRNDVFSIYNLKKNRGIHGARVYGFFKSKGNYIVFLDQDDKISEDYLVKQRQAIGSADAVVCNGYRERLCIRGKRSIYAHKSQLQMVCHIDDYIKKGNMIISPGQVLLKRESIPNLWLSAIMKSNGADDFFLWILMLKSGCIFTVNPEKLYTHIENGENSSNTFEVMNQSVIEMTSLLSRNNILPYNEIEKIQNIYSIYYLNSSIKIARVYDYWLYLGIRNIKIESYFYNHKYKNIALYGLNYLGNRFYDALQYTSINVLFGIDKEADGIEYDIPVLSLENPQLSTFINQIDIVVVTAISSYKGILYNFKKICNKPIVSLENICLELIKKG